MSISILVIVAIAGVVALIVLGITKKTTYDNGVIDGESVIFYICDGMSMSAVTLGRVCGEYCGDTGYDRSGLAPVDNYIVGSARTSSNSSWVTDSAAAGTALATSYKAINGQIGYISINVLEIETFKVWTPQVPPWLLCY